MLEAVHNPMCILFTYASTRVRLTNGLPLKALLAVPGLSEAGDQVDPVVVGEAGRINVKNGVVGLRDECASARL